MRVLGGGMCAREQRLLEASGLGPLGTEITGYCEPLSGYWALTSGPLEEQQGLLPLSYFSNPCLNVLSEQCTTLFSKFLHIYNWLKKCFTNFHRSKNDCSVFPYDH